MRVGVIGGGPAGYAAAVRAAQLGAETVVFEKRALGGVCLNRGCVPTKNLLAWARAFRRAVREGFLPDEPAPIGPALRKAEEAASRHASAVRKLLAGYGVRVVEAHAELVEPFVIEAAGERHRFDRVIVATGSRPVVPPTLAVEGALTGEDMFRLAEDPGRVVIVGGGVQGIEFASFFRLAGYEVTVVEMMPTVLPFLPAGVARAYAARLKRRGVVLATGSVVERVERAGAAYRLALADGRDIACDTLMVLVGRVPVAEWARVEGLVDERGFAAVDDRLEMAIEGHFAAGDCVRSYGLAYTAYVEGRLAAERALGREAVRPDLVPHVVFGDPEIAWVGRLEGEEIKVPMGLSALAGAEGEDDGSLSLFFENGHLVGGVVVGGPASELVHVVGALVVGDADGLVFIHPSYAELVGEALEAAAGRPRHLAPRRPR